MLTKTPSDVIGNPAATFRLVVQCLSHLRYGMINCPRRIQISFFFCSTKYTLPCSQDLPFDSVLQFISADHTLTSHNFKALINTIIPSKDISYKVHYSIQKFRLIICVLISCMSCVKHIYPISSSIHLCAHTPSSLGNCFPQFSKKKLWL